MNARTFHSAALPLLAVLIGLPSEAAEAANQLPHRVAVNGVEFLLVPAGEFTYTVQTGASVREKRSGQPFFRHVRIELDAFYIAKYEATADDLARFLNAADVPTALKESYRRGWASNTVGDELPTEGCTLRYSAEGSFERKGESRLPATDLSWEHARAFSHWMGFRLPTEAEWQKAARGTDQRIWPWGDRYGDDTLANFAQGRGCNPVAVDLYPRGVSPYGAYQMGGNVEEYVEDWYNIEFDAQRGDGDRNPRPADTGTPFPYEGPRKISKGGDWSPGMTFLTIAMRTFADPGHTASRHGVRFALDGTRVKELIEQGRAHPLAVQIQDVTEKIDEQR